MMTNKVKSIFTSKKARIAAIVACAILLFFVGMVIYAVFPNRDIANEGDGPPPVADGDATWHDDTQEEGPQDTNESSPLPLFTVQVVDGVTYFSTDNGVTWSEEIPDVISSGDDSGMGFNFVGE